MPAPTTESHSPGQVRIELVDSAIDPQSLREFLADPDCGAVAWFEGVTRRMTGNHETVDLTYEAFEPMATAQLRSLAAEAAERFSLHRVAITHRLGTVPIGQASILIGISAAHRAGALAALPWLMDRIKTDVTIWKRDRTVDGQTAWIHPQ